MYQDKITSEELNKLGLRYFEGDIVLVDSEEKVDAVVIELSQEKLLGFDTETRPSFKKGKVNQVALLQLSTRTTAYLFRMHLTGLPISLKALLADASITKVGVAIRDDIKSLQKVSAFVPAGFIDLQAIVKDFGVEELGLKRMAAIILNFNISKSQTLSNWESEELTERQLRYAATDAWVCFEIYTKLEYEKRNE